MALGPDTLAPKDHSVFPAPYLGRDEQIFPGDDVLFKSGCKRSSDLRLIVVAPSWKWKWK